MKLHIRLKCQSNNHLQRNQIRRSWILLCVAGILTFGIFPNLMPSFNVDGEQVKVTMTEIVQFFMYLSVAINLLMMKINTSDILSSNIAQSAIGALLQYLAQVG